MARKAQKEMRILGIETSCDETGAAIVEDGTKILSNIITSSQSFHIKSGGIIPEGAARQQVKYLLPTIEKAIQQFSNLTINDIDALAATVGPGLIGSLLVGVETAKTLAYLFRKPIVPVNHVLAHFYANWLETRKTTNKDTQSHKLLPNFPAVGLIASGGHTDLVLMEGHGKLRWLGGTRDDASGEAFDKIARLLGLPYPGGPAIAAQAAKAEKSRMKNQELRIRLPRPMIDEDTFDFSFSGLKTAVLREINHLKAIKQFSNLAICKLAYEVQEAITDVLVEKTLQAAQKYQVKSILLGGGVTANDRLREKFMTHNSQFIIHLPPPGLCTDNAAVVASFADFNYHPRPWSKIEALPDLHF